MKRILFLLLFLPLLAISQVVPPDATPLENIQITNNIQSTTASRATVQENNGVQNYIPINSLPIGLTPINYSIPNNQIISHLSGIDTRLGQIGNTTAGVTNRIYFTGDNTTVTAGTFFASNATGKGSVTAASPTALVNGDNTKQYFDKDLISIAQPSNTIAPAGNYSGQLTVSSTPTPNGTQQRYTIEVYRTNNSGTPIASGVSGAPVGDLGVTVIAILDSGLINLTAGALTNVTVTGILTSQITINTGERLRYHVSAAKIGAGGGNVTMNVFYGSNYNSFYDVTVAQTTDGVLNKSSVTGLTSTDALNNLKNTKLNLIDAKQFGAAADGTANDTSILQAYLDSGQGIYIFPKGNYSVSGLDVNPYSQLYFEEGAVLVLRNNSDRPVLQNKNFSANTDKNIEIYGLEIEGNEANQVKFGVTAPYTGEPTSGVRFFGVENLKIIGAKINKTRTYGIWISRVKNVIARDIEFNQSIIVRDNQDGIHFNGLCYNLDISNIRGVTNDDMIALNTNDVAQGSNVSLGEIKNATIKDIIFDNNLNGIRLLSAGNLMDQIYINNLSGNVRDNVIAVSSYNLGNANFGSIYIDGVNVKTNTPFNVMGEYGGYILINDKIEYIKVSNVYRETGSDARPTVRIQGRASIRKLVIDNITDKINQSLTTYYPEISFEANSIVDQAFISNIRLMNGLYPNGFCIGATNSAITRLHLDNIYAEQIGYGLYLNNTDISTLFINNTSTNFIRYPFYLVNDSDISNALINNNGWLYSLGTPNVYNILDTSSIVFSGSPTAQTLVKWDDNYNLANSSISETPTVTSVDRILRLPQDKQLALGLSSATNGSNLFFDSTNKRTTFSTNGGNRIIDFVDSSRATLINGATDNATDKLIVNGTASGTTDATVSSQYVRLGQMQTAVQLSVRPYKSYTFSLSQTSTLAPTVSETYENTLSGTPIFAYTGVGTYTITLTGAFTANKTFISISNNGRVSGSPIVIYARRTSSDIITINSYTASTLTDGNLTNAFLEIRVYN